MTYTLVTAPHGSGALRYSKNGVSTLVWSGAKPECWTCEAALGECENCGAITCADGGECDLPTPVEYLRYAATLIDPAEWAVGCSACLRDPYQDDDRW